MLRQVFNEVKACLIHDLAVIVMSHFEDVIISVGETGLSMFADATWHTCDNRIGLVSVRTQTLLPVESMLYIFNVDRTPFKSIDLLTGEHHPVPSLPFRGNMCYRYCMLNNHVYAVEDGIFGEHRIFVLEKTWREVTTFEVERLTDFSVIGFNNCIFIIGGSSSDRGGIAQAFNTITSTWSSHVTTNFYMTPFALIVNKILHVVDNNVDQIERYTDGDWVGLNIDTSEWGCNPIGLNNTVYLPRDGPNESFTYNFDTQQIQPMEDPPSLNLVIVNSYCLF